MTIATLMENTYRSARPRTCETVQVNNLVIGGDAPVPGDGRHQLQSGVILCQLLFSDGFRS